jgi:hypothetical protein
VSLAAMVGLLSPPLSASACAGGHLGVRWVTFQAPVNDFGPVFFYHSVEPATSDNLPVTIQGTGDDCSNPPQPVFGTYQVMAPPAGTPSPATSGLDYTPVTPRQTGPLYGYHAQGPTEHPDNVQLLGDVLIETVAERAQATITASTGRREVPWDVPVYILDDDGTDRVAFESAGPYERSEIYGSISVPVFRAGPATSAATFSLTAEGSSANPATTEDHGPIPGTVSFEAGERVKLVTIQLVNDKTFEPPEELTLTLTDPGTVLPEDPVTTTVRILDSIGSSGLESRLHHPKQRFTYRASDYRIREVHIFTVPGQGAPVSSAELAIRRNMKGGKCKWLAGKRFKPGDCQNERWLGTDQYETDFFYKRLKELAPSKRKVKSYTAFSRAINGTGEVETFLQAGRNQNTFKVKPAKKKR